MLEGVETKEKRRRRSTSAADPPLAQVLRWSPAGGPMFNPLLPVFFTHML